jgi:hypothetical protein
VIAMASSRLVNRWSGYVSVSIAGTKDKYSQCTYTSDTIQGRLIETEEEVIIKNGTKVIVKAKLLSTTQLSLDDKVGNYKIISTKECKDKNNVIQFYKYFLK